MAEGLPPVLIEKWLPVQESSIECMRERSAVSVLPAINFLHVWWARRPLTISRTAILASLLPVWSKEWPVELRKKFPTEDIYRAWFLRLIGILGDPVAGKKLIQYAKDKNIKLKGNPYGYPRAFTVSPGEGQFETLKVLLELNWGTSEISVMDPMAGGGSIPFEALRYGFTTYANELNPVASVILKATLEYPRKYGMKLADDLKKYGDEVIRRVKERLEPYFPVQQGESIQAYIWARTVACPTTGKPVPLSPNWWLRKSTESVAVKPIFKQGENICTFEIIRGRKAIETNPDEGTVRNGVGKSPWTNEVIDREYIKKEAQSGRMGQQLYALAIKTNKGNDFRVPSDEDLRSINNAEQELGRIIHEWKSKGIIPVEVLPDGNKTSEPIRHGIETWSDMFSPRQLLTLGTYLESLNEIFHTISEENEVDIAKALQTYLAIAFDKCCDYNSRMVRWHSSRGVVAGTFDRHDYSFKWSHGEFDGAHNLLSWSMSQIIKAYKELAGLVYESGIINNQPAEVVIYNKSATNLIGVENNSINLICVDPPYYDNVMYAECSDFFYVWMKRILGNVYPEFFINELTNKDDEVVANPARFATVTGKKKKELAENDYQRKMFASFKEMHRILKPGGILTVMFTHKKVEAWDTLASALIEAGFKVETSWPVHTESEHSLHQAKKNAASSTILLVCRKRDIKQEEVWWEDIKGRVREVARDKAQEFEEAGISGVDLYLSTFGPVLAVISENWPVLTSEIDEKTGKPVQLKPETALEIAREEVVALRKKGLLLGRKIEFDPATDWYLLAWDAFRAEQFPADEARKLAIALGLDVENDLVKTKRIINKSGSMVAINDPKARRKKGMVDPEADSFGCAIDAVHTAMLVYEEDGPAACRRFLTTSGLIKDSTFKACLQAMLNVIPRTRKKEQFIRKEAETLEAIRLAYFEDIEAPPEEVPDVTPEQAELKLEGESEPEEELDEGEGEEEGQE
jgi:putative DNA methylase